jgi:predicted aconitase with swiveling domain
MPVITSRALIEGEAEGRLLILESDISFWGGIDPNTGDVIDNRHPQFGESVAGRILAMNRSIGSSSGSSILLELCREGNGIQPDPGGSGQPERFRVPGRHRKNHP